MGRDKLDGREKFSRAERSACLQVLRKYGWQVTDEAWDVCRETIGRHVSKRTLGIWRDKALASVADQPKRSTPHKTIDFAVDLEEADSLSGEEIQGTLTVQRETKAPGDLDIGQRLEFTIEELLRMSPDQLVVIPPVQRLRLVPNLLDALAKAKAVDEDIVRLVPVLRRFMSVCQPRNLDPELTLADLTAHIEAYARPLPPADDSLMLPTNGEPVLEATSIRGDDTTCH